MGNPSALLPRARSTARAIAQVGILAGPWVLQRSRLAFCHEDVSIRTVTLTPDDFHTVFGREPVLIKGLLNHFSFTELLVPHVMKAAWGDVETMTYQGPRNQTGFLLEYSENKKINYGELIDSIFYKKNPESRFYSRHGGDLTVLRELKACKTPRPFEHFAIWIGEDENITPFHCDPWHSFLGQTYGSKRVTLVPPEDAKYLHLDVFPLLDGEVNRRGPCRLPDDVRGLEGTDALYAQARRLELTIGPGDLLYIPPGWWHWVVTTAPSVSVLFRYDSLFREIIRVPEVIHHVWRDALHETGIARRIDPPPWRGFDLWPKLGIDHLRMAASRAGEPPPPQRR